MTAASETAAELHPLERAIVAAQSESIEANLARWHRFAGAPAWLELQALDVAGDRPRWIESRYAHADRVADAVRLATVADKWNAPGVYIIANKINPAIATRGEAGAWIGMKKGEGTTDDEIAARSVLFVDVDAVRPKNTSATADEMAHTSRVAVAIYEELAAIVEDERPLGFGHSGNGRAILLALADLDRVEAGRLHHGILIALGARYDSAHVKIDRSVHDAKRLLPCWGTTKKKGRAGVEERPHRKTAFVCGEDVARLSLDDLERVLATLRHGLGDDVQREIDRALGVKVAPKSSTKSPTGDASRGVDPAWGRANAVPIAEVLAELGLYDGEHPTCPGCGLSGDSSVAIVGNGLKCSHARCADKGYSAGFRTPVDCWCEARHVTPAEAVREMAERFGFEGFGHDGSFNVNGGEAGHAGNSSAPREKTSYGPGDFVRSWVNEPKLARLVTGFPTVDDACRGGLAVPARRHRRRSARGKTFLATVLGSRFMALGNIYVGHLGIDEEPEDLEVRHAQMQGFTIEDCETRDPKVLARIEAELVKLPLRMYGPDWTIEAAAEDLAMRAPAGWHRVLIIDSVHTAQCEGSRLAEGPRELVEANVRAIRAVTSKHRLLTITTSESNRGQYANAIVSAQANRMASGAESRALEFSAQTLIYLGTPKKFPNVIEANVPKNRRGARGSFEFWMTLDRERHQLSETSDPAAAAAMTDEEAVEAGQREQREAAKFMALMIAHNPGVGTKGLRRTVKAAGKKLGSDAIDDAAMFAVRLGLVVDHSKRHGKTTHHKYYAADVTVTDCDCDACALKASNRAASAKGAQGCREVPLDVPGTSGEVSGAGVPHIAQCAAPRHPFAHGIDGESTRGTSAPESDAEPSSARPRPKRGPQTPEAKARASESQRRRWAEWRAAKAAEVRAPTKSRATPEPGASPDAEGDR